MNNYMGLAKKDKKPKPKAKAKAKKVTNKRKSRTPKKIAY
jgi:hypothetical protein|tara:strand:- start:38 stop:157 length:120 start_codon:yes stop_codon:yes gene_type:complete